MRKHISDILAAILILPLMYLFVVLLIGYGA